MHEVAEVEVADGDVAFEDFFESGFEVDFEFAVKLSGKDEGSQSWGKVAVGSAYGFDDQTEAMVGFGEAFDFLEILGGVLGVGAGNEILLHLANVGDKLAGSPVFLIPFRLGAEPALHEFLADHLDEQVMMIRVLEDEAVVAFGERFGVLEDDHGLS